MSDECWGVTGSAAASPEVGQSEAVLTPSESSQGDS